MTRSLPRPAAYCYSPVAPQQSADSYHLIGGIVRDFLFAVLALLFSTDGQIPAGTELTLLVFAAGASFMGVVVVVLDWMSHQVRGHSFLRLSYGGAKTLRMLAFWGLGAGVGGFVGAAANVFEVQRVACLTAGISWPLVLPRVVAASEEDEQEEQS